MSNYTPLVNSELITYNTGNIIIESDNVVETSYTMPYDALVLVEEVRGNSGGNGVHVEFDFRKGVGLFLDGVTPDLVWRSGSLGEYRTTQSIGSPDPYAQHTAEFNDFTYVRSGTKLCVIDRTSPTSKNANITIKLRFFKINR